MLNVLSDRKKKTKLGDKVPSENSRFKFVNSVIGSRRVMVKTFFPLYYFLPLCV